MMVFSLRAPIFSVVVFISSATRAISFTAPLVKLTESPSASSIFLCCSKRLCAGSVRTLSRSFLFIDCSPTRTGRRPWSSAMRSFGFVEWNAPAAMNKMKSVFTGPIRVSISHPSMSGRRSLCTPSEEQSGPPSPPLLFALLQTLSISSMNTIPSCSHASRAWRSISGVSDALASSTLERMLRASLIATERLEAKPPVPEKVLRDPDVP
mmetsp:Transcript_8215/g.16005  ORF Transcript_8215/g.16005 Transcript_8215/m.16005 type:complete len:209 (+) Transcript_8215:348-974(+)